MTTILIFPVWNATIVEIDIGTSFDVVENHWLLTVAIISIALCIGAIFLHKNRPLQMKLGWLNILVVLVLGGLIYYFSQQMDNPFAFLFEVTIGLGTIAPVVNVIFTLLAIYSIRKDEKLIESMDRIR